jgi:hypothetical protein
MTLQLLTYSALVERGIFNNRMTLKRAMDKYGFPRPYKLGGRRVAWSREAVEAWLASRQAGGGEADATQ